MHAASFASKEYEASMYIAILDLNIIPCILDIGFAKAPHLSNEPVLLMCLLVANCLCFG